MTPVGTSKHRSVAELQAGDRIDDEVYRIAEKDLRTTANGGLYIHAMLADATGRIIARMWNATQQLFDSMPEGGFLYVRGRVENYKGARQFVIDGVRAVPDGAIDPGDFLPSTRHDVEAMWQRVKEILRTIKQPDLLALIARFVKDETFVEAFKRAPAARTNHHAYLGGLLEHTLNLMELGLAVMPRYPELSADLVIAGLFLHDAGKTTELAYETNFEYPNDGQLIGHLVQVVIWVDQKAREIEADTGQPFPADLLSAFKHILLSHHGKYEFGSPKLPALPEAVLVHHLDNIDAKIQMMLTAAAEDPDRAADWTGFIRTLETKVFKVDFRMPRG